MENEPAILHSLAIENGQIVEVDDPAMAKQLIGTAGMGTSGRDKPVRTRHS